MGAEKEAAMVEGLLLSALYMYKVSTWVGDGYQG